MCVSVCLDMCAPFLQDLHSLGVKIFEAIGHSVNTQRERERKINGAKSQKKCNPIKTGAQLSQKTGKVRQHASQLLSQTRKTVDV